MELKFCNLCKKEKSINEFAWKLVAKKLKQSYCKECQNIRSKAHYNKYKAKYIKKARKRNKEILEQIHKYVWEFLSKNPCIDCGETDIVVLEFDHKTNKLYNISDLIKDRSSLVKVKTELENCVVRCANCHRRKTAREFGWSKIKYAPLAQ